MPDDHASPEFITDRGPAGRVDALAVDPADSLKLYATIGEGKAVALYLSTDRGVHWQRSSWTFLAGAARFRRSKPAAVGPHSRPCSAKTRLPFTGWLMETRPSPGGRRRGGRYVRRLLSFGQIDCVHGNGRRQAKGPIPQRHYYVPRRRVNLAPVLDVVPLLLNRSISVLRHGEAHQRRHQPSTSGSCIRFLLRTCTLAVKSSTVWPRPTILQKTWEFGLEGRQASPPPTSTTRGSPSVLGQIGV